MITAAHGHSQSQGSHHCVARLLGGNRISNGEDQFDRRGCRPPELSFTGRNTTAETATSPAILLFTHLTVSNVDHRRIEKDTIYREHRLDVQEENKSLKKQTNILSSSVVPAKVRTLGEVSCDEKQT
ncbi:hypothetical protein EVAR_100146_1 [Eumeta japonica]|uniref:Uncharacterized protein n=1 Tax=Eumeta variegata TaxID=151549 RepID=A0A4C1ZQN5_EUMVA|nr:hypothetical protein EVAR_100146_1 [Eumeta japonica]